VQQDQRFAGALSQHADIQPIGMDAP
jgi:hypothetical protein